MNFWRSIPRPIIGLSPMDGVTDPSFRFITAKHGRPDVILTEFVNIQSAIYAPEQMLKDLTYAEIERPVVAQIYGKTPELFYKVAHIVGELGFDGLDINKGCPARRGTQYYRIEQASQCDRCPVQKQCTRAKNGRRILVVGAAPYLVEKRREEMRAADYSKSMHPRNGI